MTNSDQNDNTQDNKDEQAREGEARPRQAYDPEFDKYIRELRPDWFTD